MSISTKGQATTTILYDKAKRIWLLDMKSLAGTPNLSPNNFLLKATPTSDRSGEKARCAITSYVSAWNRSELFLHRAVGCPFDKERFLESVMVDVGVFSYYLSESWRFGHISLDCSIFQRRQIQSSHGSISYEQKAIIVDVFCNSPFWCQ